ncbi:hypothetical protein HD596_003310 [Nonomuraea jabiensis]|uniref:Uncharacterized protein n=1 Tax=Nonomuraea jabiensis TaxID=882448 RepID=A0A7W9G3G6_9ACTN|nr:hypothetical protein [Nonomuraea jabiensis]
MVVAPAAHQEADPDLLTDAQADEDEDAHSFSSFSTCDAD